MRGLRCDPWLAAILAAATLFCVYGMHWGRVECWNFDEVALRPLNGLHPGYFFKPPFHTYLNHLVVFFPVHVGERLAKFFIHAPVRFNEARLIGSRLLTAGLFLGTIAFAFAISLRFYGRFAARIVALLFATGAGFIAFAHFLTCDLPMLFWMMGAACFAARIAHSGRTRDYVLAGLFSGLAAATKYNGVLVGVAIGVAHLFSPNCRGLRDLFHRRVLLGLALIPLGFIAGNPYAILDFKRFSADFMYNYTVAPQYEGQSGVGYGEFLRALPEVVGIPGTIVIVLCLLGSAAVVLVRRGPETRNARIGFLIAASVAVLYYLALGSFARIPTRFVLPAVPFLILMAGPLLSALEMKRRALVVALLVPLTVYNVICCAFVGKRFSDDPRLAAQNWMIAHARAKTIQSSYISPHWTKLSGLRGVEFAADGSPHDPAPPNSTVDWRMPVANGRTQLFSKIFAGNRWVEEGMSVEGKPEEMVFSEAGQTVRNPDLITIYSFDVEVPVEFVRTYYNDLLAERLGYKIAFQGTTPAVSPLLYPKVIDCLSGTMTILSR